MKRLVSYSTNGTTSALAKRALRLLGEEVPRPIVPCVPSWKEAEVQTWLQQIGFSQHCERFRVEPRWPASSESKRAHPGGCTAARGALHIGGRAHALGPHSRGARVPFWGWGACTQPPLSGSLGSNLGPICLHPPPTAPRVSSSFPLHLVLGVQG